MLFFCLPGFGQYLAQNAKNNLGLKLSLLPMFHIDNAFVLATEIPFNNGKISIQPEIGYGHAKNNKWYYWRLNDDYPDKTTLRTKLQVRAYYREGSTFRSYAGGELGYWQSDYHQTRRPESASVPQTITLQRKQHSIHGIMGWQGYFGRRFVIDFYVGMGLKATENLSRTKGLSEKELEDIRLDDRVWFGRNRRMGRYGPYPDLIGAVQLGILLGKVD